MTEVQGIKETKEVISLALEIGLAAKKAMEDGKIGPEDLALIITIFPAIQPALENIGEVPAELKDLSPAEAEEIAAFVIAKIPGIASEKALDVATKAVKAAVANYTLVKAISG